MLVENEGIRKGSTSGVTIMARVRFGEFYGITQTHNARLMISLTKTLR